MKLFHILATAGVATLLIGCGGSRPLMSFEYASASESKIDSRNAKSYGEVKSSCVSAGQNDLGLMETAVAEAVAQTPGATFLKEPKFVTFGSCISVSGTAMGPQ